MTETNVKQRPQSLPAEPNGEYEIAGEFVIHNGCGFRFGAEHWDDTEGKRTYTCPSCMEDYLEARLRKMEATA